MSDHDREYSAAIVVIGNEILSGRTQDANVAFLGKRFAELGILLAEVRIIRDDEGAIGDAINALRGHHDYVFTTGGIGPTHDDITARSVARALDRPFGRNADAEAILRRYYKPDDITEARLSMADMPDDVELLDNPVSGAPGFRADNVYVLPGVPSILQVMFDGFAGTLKGGAPTLSFTVSGHVQEGRISAPLRAIQEAHPLLEIGSYPFFRDGKLGASLVIRGKDEGDIARAADAVRAMIRDFGEEPIER